MTEKVANKQVDLDINSVDAGVAMGKGLVGALVPLIGAPLAELVGFAIPKQRLDRVVEVLNKVQSDVNDLKAFIEKASTPEGTDLVDEAIRQSTRAFTKERREYISNLLRNNLTKEEIKHDQKKKLFYLLNQLKDHEIIHLKNYSFRYTIGPMHMFVKKHYDILGPVTREQGRSQEEINRTIFRDSFKNNLTNLGLIKQLGNTTITTELGNLLLAYIEVPDGSEEVPED